MSKNSSREKKGKKLTKLLEQATPEAAGLNADGPTSNDKFARQIQLDVQDEDADIEAKTGTFFNKKDSSRSQTDTQKHYVLQEMESPVQKKNSRLIVESERNNLTNEELDSKNITNNGLDGDQNKSMMDTDVSITDWALKLGTGTDQAKTESIEDLLKPNKDDVYPLSIHYTQSQQFKMKIIRIVAFLICFYFLVPFDLYIESHHRLYYYGTDVYKERIHFDNPNATKYTFELINCKVYLYPDDIREQSFLIEYGFEFNTNHTINDTYLYIKASASQTCIVNLYLPSIVDLPKFTFNLTGTQDNIMINDQGLRGIQLSFSKGLDIYGDTVFVDLNNHYISTLFVTLRFSVFQLTNVRSNVKDVYIETGLFNDLLHPQENIVIVRANQPQGHICLASPQSIQIQNQTCQIINNPFLNLTATASNTTTVKQTCRIDSMLCSSGASCVYERGLTVPMIFVTVNDGPVQVKFQEQTLTNYTTISRVKTKIEFTESSRFILNTSSEIFLQDIANDRIQVLQTLGINYAKTWLYTNKIQFLQAQFWPLVWGSAGLLRPKVEYSKIIVIDYECPARAQTLQFDSDINDFLFQWYPTTTSSKVAWVMGYNNLYEVSRNDFGDSKYGSIQMNQNKMIVNAFAIAGVIAFFFALLCVQLSIMLVKTLKIQYKKFLVQQKQVAVTSKQTQMEEMQGAVDMQSVMAEFEASNRVYEYRGLFKSEFIIDPEFIVKAKLTFQFSLYQIPALLLDYFFRKKVNSLREFIYQIHESKIHFTNQKMKEHDKSQVSIPVYEFEQIYSNFCQKNGYTQVTNLEDEESAKVFKSYGLNISETEGKQVPSYVNIKIKSMKQKLEQQEEEQPIDLKKSIVSQFLAKECVQSQFDSDYISFEELKMRYADFCKKMGIQESKREQIIGNDELIKFGSQIKDKNPPKTIIGVKKGKSEKKYENTAGSQFGLIRITVGLKGSIMQKFMSVDGIVPNALLSIVLFILILIVPLVTPVISFLALCEMTSLQGDVYRSKISFLEFFNTNRLDPWWDNVPHLLEVSLIHLYVLFYLIFAYVELISFFMTGYGNQGKFPVYYSKPKRFFMIAFYISIGIFLFLYIAMGGFTLVWALLASILNPSVFLPYTAAALALIATFSGKLLEYKDKFNKMKAQLQEVVTQKIGEAFKKSLESAQNQVNGVAGDKAALNGAVDPAVAQKELDKGLSNLFSGESGDTKSSDKGLDASSTVEALARQVCKNLDGLNPVVTEIIIAVITNNEEKIHQSIKDLGNTLKVDGELLDSIAQIVMCPYNPQRKEKQDSFGEVELAVKRLFRCLIPDLPFSDYLGDICKLTLQKDPSPIIRVVEKVFPKDRKTQAKPVIQLFKILSLAMVENKSQMKRELIGMTQELLKNKDSSFFDVFQLLSDLREADVLSLLNESAKLDENSKKSAKLLGFKHSYPILCLADIFTRSSTLSFSVLINSLKEILADGGFIDDEQKKLSAKYFNTNNQQFTLTEKFFLALMYITKGDGVDLKSIAQSINKRNPNSQPLDGDILDIIHSVGHNSIEGFEQLVFKLGCSQSRELLLEFFQLIKQKRGKYLKTFEKLIVPEKQRGNLVELANLLFLILSYELTIKEKQEYHRKELSQLRNNVIRCLKSIKDEKGDPIDVSDIVDFSDLFDKSISREESNMESSLNSSRAYFPDQSDIIMNSSCSAEDGTNQDQKLKQVIKVIFPLTLIKGTDLHKKLWDGVLKLLKQSDIHRDDIMSFIRSIAMIMLRVNDKLKQSDLSYLKCLKELSEFFEVSEESLEMMVDSIHGNPLDILKVQNKLLVEYNFKDDHPKGSEFKGNFDKARVALLQTLLKGTSQTIVTVFIRWYHQYRYTEIARETITTHILQTLKLNQVFIDVIDLYLQDKESVELKMNIHGYIKQQIGKIQSKQGLTPRIGDFYPITDKFFGDENSKAPLKIEEFRPEDQNKLLAEAEIFEKLIRLKEIDNNILKHITGDTQSKSPSLKAIKNLLQLSCEPQAHLILSYIKSLAKVVPLYKQDQFLNIFGGSKNQGSISTNDQQDFIALVFLLNSNALQQYCKNERLKINNFGRQINSILDLDGNGDKYVHLEEKEFPHSVRILHQNDFMNKVSMGLIKPLHEKLTEDECQAVTGLLIGSASRDKKLIRLSLKTLICDKGVEEEILEGFVSILLGDIEAEENIKEVSDKLDIDGKLVIDLMDITSHQTKNLPNILMNLMNTNSKKDENKLCMSVVSLFKGDLQSAKLISQKLKVNHNYLMAVLSAATGNLSILGEYYSWIQEILGLSSQTIVRYLFQLCHGHTQCIQQLSQQRTSDFYICEVDLTSSLYKLCRFGNQMHTNKLTIERHIGILSMDTHINIVARKLSTIFNIKNEKLVNLTKSMKLILRACWNHRPALASIYKKLQKFGEKNSIWVSENEESQSQLSKLLSETEILDFISQNLQIIISNRISVEEYIFNTQRNILKVLRTVLLPALIMNDEELQKGSNEDAENQEENKEDTSPSEDKSKKKQETIAQKFLKALMKKFNNKIFENEDFQNAVKQIEDLNRRVSTDSKQKYEDRLERLKDDKLINAYRIGCTFGISLYSRISQPLYMCITCNQAMGTENIAICKACALFCHKGHKLAQAGDELFVNSYCECGSGSFNSCRQLNSNNPLDEFKGQGQCSILHNAQKAILQKSSEEFRASLKNTASTISLLSKYTTESFLNDINTCLNLPTYFEDEIELQASLLKEEILVKNKKGQLLMKDTQSNSKISLAENMILLSSGQISQSLISILATKKSYSKEDFQNQDPFVNVHNKNHNYALYQTLNCFIALGKQDIEKFQIYGNGFASVMNEVGARDSPAVEKLTAILLLAKGGDLCPLDEEEDSAMSKIFKNQYIELFKKIFGIEWKGMINLHKLLTLSQQDLSIALNLESLDTSKSQAAKLESKQSLSEDYKNLQQWTSEVLFDQYLGLSDNSTNYCKSIIGIIIGFAPAFDFLASEKDINQNKQKYFKSMIFSQEKAEWKAVFERLKRQVPEKLSEHLRKMIKGGEERSLIEFIVKYIEIEKKKQDWDEVEDFENIPDDDQTKMLIKYLQNLYHLISGEANDIDQQLDFVLKRYLGKKLMVREADQVDTKLLSSFISLYGVFNSDQDKTIRITEALELSSFSSSTLNSIISIVKGNSGSGDIKESIRAMTGRDLGKEDKELIRECKCLLHALNGDIVSMAKIVDKISNSNTHLRSLIASLVTGQTKFDSISSDQKDAIKLSKNLLLREVFRIFESAIRTEFQETQDKATIDSFIEKSFKEKVPLYLTLLLTEDKGLMEGLFSFQDNFIVSLNAKIITARDKKYLKSFIDFLNPYNPEVSIKPMIKYLLKVQKGVKFDFPIFADLFKEKVEKETSFKADLIDFLNQVFNCVTQADYQIAICNLYETYFIRSLESMPLQQQVLQLQKGMYENADIFNTLPSFMKLILQELKIDTNFDKLIEVVNNWMHSATMMLSKDKNSSKGMKEQLQDAVKSLLDYFNDSNKPDNPLAARKDSVMFIVDIVQGLISLTKGDLAGMKPLALKLGGFPTQLEKLEEFYKMIKQNKDGLSFDNVKDMGMAAATQLMGNAQMQNAMSGMASQLGLPGGIPGGAATQALLQQAMKDPKALLDPQNIFKHFCNQKGTMGFTEFQNMFTQLGLKLPHARLLQLFSIADKEKKGELNYSSFEKALDNLKQFLIEEVMQMLGVSVQDLAISFALTMIILCLMLAFIFVGIEAFAPASSFSSVTNSLLPMGAGASVNRKKAEEDEELDNMANGVELS